MGEGVGALDKIRFGLIIDLQLHFSYQGVVELHINQDIMSTIFQSILNSNNLELLWIVVADSLNFFEDTNDFLLTGGTLTSH